MRNKIILYVNHQRVKLYNFSDLTHENGFIKITCDGKNYYYPQHLTVISEVHIYE